MTQPRRRLVRRTLWSSATAVGAWAVSAFGLAVVGCTTDGRLPPEPSTLAGPQASSARTHASRAIAAAAEKVRDFGGETRPDGVMATRVLPGARGGEALPFASDQIIVHLASTAAEDLEALEVSLGASGLSLVFVDPSRRLGWVRGPEDAVAQLMWQSDTILPPETVSWDAVMEGAGPVRSSIDLARGLSSTRKDKKDGDKDHHGRAHACADSGEGPSMWHLASMSVGRAWERQPDAAPVVVAVLDTGLSLDSDGQPDGPGLAASSVLPGYDFVNLDDDPADDNGHGTLVSGVLAATGALPGVAPAVQILPVKVLDAERRGSEAALVAGIDFAVAAGADVISMSLAFPRGFMPSGSLAVAIADAQAAGVVLVAASGNHGGNEISYPAAFGEVIAVGATRLGEQTKPVSLECVESGGGRSVRDKLVHAEYSGYGVAIDVCGPGGAMDLDYDGDSWPDAVPAYGFTPSTVGEYEPFLLAGTSPATAAVAGSVALLLAHGASPEQIYPLLSSKAFAIGDEGFEVGCGSGQTAPDASLLRLDAGQLAPQPERFVNPVVSIAADTNGVRRAVAFVEVVDEHNQPVAGTTVLGHFRGAVTHDVAATTDELGRVLMTSLPSQTLAGVFEFSVDKLVDEGGDGRVIVPKGFSRFELTSFQWMSSFLAEGAGVEPSPFIIWIDPDALLPWLDDFAIDMDHGTDPLPPLLEPVRSVPPDVASWSLVPTLVTRSIGGDVAPKVVAIDRQAIVADCDLSADLIPVLSVGAGVEPSPFRLHETLLRYPLTMSEVLVRPDTIFLDGLEAPETALGLYFGESGRVLIDIEGSTCEPTSFVLANRDVLSDAVIAGEQVVDGGFHIVVPLERSLPLPGPSFPLPFEWTMLGAGQAEAPFASGLSVEASAAIGGPGSGLLPLP